MLGRRNIGRPEIRRPEEEACGQIPENECGEFQTSQLVDVSQPLSLGMNGTLNRQTEQHGDRDKHSMKI